MQCEKCQSLMVQTSVFRSSGCLAAVGFTLVIPSLLWLLLSVLLVAGWCGSGRNIARERGAAVARLKALPGFPSEAVADFADDGRLEPSTRFRLSDEEQRAFTAATADYDAAVTSGGTAALGMGVVFASYLAVLPALIIGLFLVRRRKVWRCERCGWFFERT